MGPDFNSLEGIKNFEDYIKKAIARKLLKGRTPEWIHEEDEYPMELIMDVKDMLKKGRSDDII